MLTTYTTFLGPATRSRARSSSQPMRSMAEMTAAVEQLAKGKRGSKRSTTTAPESVSTADSEMAISSPRSDPFSRGNDETMALQVWNKLFEGDNFDKLAEASDYIRVNVTRLLESGQHERMASEIVEERCFH